MLESSPIAGFDDFTFGAKIVENVRRVFASRVGFRQTSFMISRDVGNVISQFDKFFAVVVGLDGDGFPCLSDVVLETHNILETKSLAKLYGDLNDLVIG